MAPFDSLRLVGFDVMVAVIGANVLYLDVIANPALSPLGFAAFL
jgi:hypothetical protein